MNPIIEKDSLKPKDRITCNECHKEIINKEKILDNCPDSCPHCGAKISFWDWLPGDFYDEASNNMETIKKNNEGLSLFESKNYEEAIKCYDEAISLNANMDLAFLWNNKGIALCCLAQYEEAIKCFDRAIEINPNEENSWMNKGLALIDLNQPAKAIENVDKAISINSKHPKAWRAKAIALRNIGRSVEAVECFKMADSLGLAPTEEELKGLESDWNASKINKKKPKWKFW